MQKSVPIKSLVPHPSMTEHKYSQNYDLYLSSLNHVQLARVSTKEDICFINPWAYGIVFSVSLISKVLYNIECKKCWVLTREIRIREIAFINTGKYPSTRNNLNIGHMLYNFLTNSLLSHFLVRCSPNEADNFITLKYIIRFTYFWRISITFT